MQSWCQSSSELCYAYAGLIFAKYYLQLSRLAYSNFKQFVKEIMSTFHPRWKYWRYSGWASVSQICQIDPCCHLNETRSSATAEKQRVSCACLPIDWLTDRAMHRTPQNRRGCIIFLIFKRSDSTIAGRKFWHEIAKVIQVNNFAISYRPTIGQHIVI